MDHAHRVRAVVHGDVRLRVENGVDVLVVCLVVLALDGEDGNIVVHDEMRRRVVLRRERVGRAEIDLRAARLERDGQVSGLARHMQAGRQADALERLLFLEPFPDERENRHFVRGVFHAQFAAVGERKVLNVVFGHSHCHGE